MTFPFDLSIYRKDFIKKEVESERIAEWNQWKPTNDYPLFKLNKKKYKIYNKNLE